MDVILFSSVFFFQAGFEVLWYTRDFWPDLQQLSRELRRRKGAGAEAGGFPRSASRCLELRIPPHFSGPLLHKQDKLRRAGVSLKRKTKAGRRGEESKPCTVMLPAIPASYEKNQTVRHFYQSFVQCTR